MKTKDLIAKYLPRFQRPDLKESHVLEAVNDLTNELISEINQEHKTLSSFTEKDKRTAMWKLNDKANRVMQEIERQCGRRFIKTDWMKRLATVNPDATEARG